MPLGFARSVLTHQAAGGGGAATVYSWDSSGAVNSGNSASYRWTGQDFTVNNQLAIVMWFRANGTGWVDPNDNETTFFATQHQSTYPDWAELNWNKATFGWQLQMLDTANSYVDGRGYGNVTSQASFCFDGSWKCLMVSLDSTSNSSDGTKRHIYVGDTEFTYLPTGNPTGSWTASNYDAGNFRYHRTSAGGGTITSSQEVGNGFQIGPMWVYNGLIDFDTQANRRYFYNPANTDGWVDPGTDGTGGGASQPSLFLYHNGTTLVNGGSDAISISLTTQGTGSIDVISDTEGPGTGSTI